MKILLIAPCPENEHRPNTMDIPQLTLSLIAGMTPPQHEVSICEEVYGDTVDFDGDYDLIGITLMTQTCIRGYTIANEFRKRGKIVVFGGIHATCLPEEAIQYGDAVVIGEAEGGLWEEVLADSEKHKLRRFYKLDKPPDLQNHVFPRRDLIKCSSGKLNVAPIETTRGCPYNCDFCSVSRFFGTRQRHKLIKNIIAEAESCPQRYLFFLDDNITFDKEFAKNLFRELIHLKKGWVGQASINIAKDEELMKLASKSGCKALLIGFESMGEIGINKYRKSLKTLEENIQAVRRLHNNGILTMASLIFGLDSDTQEVFDLGYEFLVKSKAAFFQACAMTPYPGTPVFEKLRNEGRILTDDWGKFDSTKVIISPKNMTPEKLLESFDHIKHTIYGKMSILKRALPNITISFEQALFYFALNQGYHSNNNPSVKTNIYKNPAGVPVDFNVQKYIPTIPVQKAVF
ncbi:MAG: radical SAM protein [Bacteroidota bacterium]|nr:radical SAM protein [Bacteroidota bacterium]